MIDLTKRQVETLISILETKLLEKDDVLSKIENEEDRLELEV